MNKSQLVRAIRAHIAKGDQATDKAEQHYISAGQHLKTLKAKHGGTWDEWTELLRSQCNLSAGRASELMQIADGRTSQGEIRAKDAERKRLARNEKSSGHPEEGDRPQPAGEPEPHDEPQSIIEPTESEVEAEPNGAASESRRFGPAQMRSLKELAARAERLAENIHPRVSPEQLEQVAESLMRTAGRMRAENVKRDRRQANNRRRDRYHQKKDQAGSANLNGGGVDHWAQLSQENAETLDRWIESDTL